MLNFKNLKIDEKSLGTKKVLTGVAPINAYTNNKRTDEVVGYRYTVALPKHSFEKLGVKIEGKQLMEAPAEGYAEVDFENLEVGLYELNGKIQVSARATGIAPVRKTN